MPNRRSTGQPPQIVFTADFHQLVQGELRPGPCVLRYDPFRIIPQSEFAQGRPIKMHVIFRPVNRLWERVISARPGQLQVHLADPAGQNFMLEVSFDLPVECEELECWFTYIDNAGHERVDDGNGARYFIRFPLHDLSAPQGAIIDSQDPAYDRLEISVGSNLTVESVVARWRLTHPPAPRQETPLIATAGPEGKKNWKVPPPGLPVPCRATAVFDLVYYVNGRKFTDDNEGTWYLAAPVGVIAGK